MAVSGIAGARKACRRGCDTWTNTIVVVRGKVEIRCAVAHKTDDVGTVIGVAVSKMRHSQGKSMPKNLKQHFLLHYYIKIKNCL
ncbi:hypothetical protein Pfo_015666 [Paulownia fortunei]|nr:hypothetical protein Pfo_015666 [Paulownia fortunei]